MQDLTFQQMSLKMKRKEEVLGMRYEIKGDTLPVVVCYLEGGEQMITERGSMRLDVSEYEDGDYNKMAGWKKRLGVCFQARRCFRIVIQQWGGMG